MNQFFFLKKMVLTGQGRVHGHSSERAWWLVCPFGHVVGVLHWFRILSP